MINEGFFLYQMTNNLNMVMWSDFILFYHQLYPMIIFIHATDFEFFLALYETFNKAQRMTNISMQNDFSIRRKSINIDEKMK